MNQPIQRFAAAIALAFCFALPALAEDAGKPDFDINRVREIYERQQKGEKLSAEDQAYLAKARASRKADQAPAARAGGAGGSGIDWDRAKALYQREQNGEKLSAEDQAYLEKAKAARQAADQGGGAGAAPARNPDAPAAKPAAGGIDWERAKAIFQRQQNGEKISAEDEAYLEKAKAAKQAADPGGAPAGNPAVAGIDWERAKALYQREQSGEKLSAEDQAYLDKAKAARAGGGGGQPARTPAAPGAGAGIDWERAKALHQREQNGDKLSAEDQAYLDKAKAAIRGGARPDGGNGENPPRRKPGADPNANPSAAGKTSIDVTPLTDLGAGEKYKDQDGGLYGNGQNHPTGELLKLAMATSAAVQPLDDSGAPSPNGKIVLMSIGMSNTTMEFSRFKQLADADSRKAANLAIVDAAQGGRDAPAWLNDQTWQTAGQRLTAAGVTARQVQVLWIKQAIAGAGRHGEFPKHAEDLKANIEQIMIKAREHYPNVKLAYLSSRIYAGYAGTQLNPEPYAYEGAFSVRWVIQDQMKGGDLNADPAKGEIKAPLALWGPYLWADGIKGRKIDSVIYERADLGGDGTHPSNSGREKVAGMLLSFFTTDETAKGWFVKK